MATANLTRAPVVEVVHGQHDDAVQDLPDDGDDEDFGHGEDAELADGVVLVPFDASSTPRSQKHVIGPAVHGSPSPPR